MKTKLLLLLLFICFSFTSSKGRIYVDLIKAVTDSNEIFLCKIGKSNPKVIELTDVEYFYSKGREIKSYKIHKRILRDFKNFSEHGEYLVLLKNVRKNVRKNNQVMLVFPVSNGNILLNQISWSELKSFGFKGEFATDDEFRILNFNNKYLTYIGYKIELKRFLNIIKIIKNQDTNKSESVQDFEVGSLEYSIFKYLKKNQN
jgi:hypothetical protein